MVLRAPVAGRPEPERKDLPMERSYRFVDDKSMQQSDETQYSPVNSEMEAPVIRAIAQWASAHPAPDHQAIRVGSFDYSPRQIASEVREHTSAGHLILRVVENALRHCSLQEVLQALESSHRSPGL